MHQFCNECYLSNVCSRWVAVIPSVKTVRDPEVRLAYQNHLVGLGMSWSAMVDYHVNVICHFPGRYVDESGCEVPPPSYLPILNPGADFWFRDQLHGGKWCDVDDVPRFRNEAAGKWIIVGTVKYINETIFPPCHPR